MASPAALCSAMVLVCAGRGLNRVLCKCFVLHTGLIRYIWDSEISARVYQQTEYFPILESEMGSLRNAYKPPIPLALLGYLINLCTYVHSEDH